MEDDRDLKEIKDLLRALLDTEAEQTDRLGATARSVTRLAQGLSLAEENRGAESAELDRIRHALMQLITVVSERDVAHATAEQIAQYSSLEAVSRARQILWARKNGQPEPLPPAPVALALGSTGEIESVHMHRRKDDSIAFKADKDGHARLKADIKVKTLLGWVAAAALAALHIWRTIVGH